MCKNKPSRSPKDPPPPSRLPLPASPHSSSSSRPLITRLSIVSHHPPCHTSCCCLCSVYGLPVLLLSAADVSSLCSVSLTVANGYISFPTAGGGISSYKKYDGCSHEGYQVSSFTIALEQWPIIMELLTPNRMIHLLQQQAAKV